MPEAEILEFTGKFTGPSEIIEFTCSEKTEDQIKDLMDWFGVDKSTTFKKVLTMFERLSLSDTERQHFVFYQTDNVVSLEVNSFDAYNKMFRFQRDNLVTRFKFKFPSQEVIGLENLKIRLGEDTTNDLFAQAVHTTWSWLSYCVNGGWIEVIEKNGERYPLFT